jgi:hypothetical protein
MGPPTKAPSAFHVPDCTEPVLAHVYVPSPTGLPSVKYRHKVGNSKAQTLKTSVSTIYKVQRLKPGAFKLMGRLAPGAFKPHGSTAFSTAVHPPPTLKVPLYVVPSLRIHSPSWM